MKNCEICRKELYSTQDEFYREGKLLCKDCAYPKKCDICGTMAKIGKRIKLNNKTVCSDCAFLNGEEEHKQFVSELEQLNSKNKSQFKKDNKKKIILYHTAKIMIWFTAFTIFGLITALVVRGFIPNMIIGSILGGLAVFSTKALNKPCYIEITEEEYYKVKYNIELLFPDTKQNNNRSLDESPSKKPIKY